MMYYIMHGKSYYAWCYTDESLAKVTMNRLIKELLISSYDTKYVIMKHNFTSDINRCYPVNKTRNQTILESFENLFSYDNLLRLYKLFG